MYKKDILLKSLNTEVFKSTFGILLIFFLLVVGSRAVGYFEQASEGIINPNLIYKIIFLRIPDFTTLLIPLSFFLGVLLTISRMYVDREIYAFFSVGLSSIDLIKFLIPQTILYFFLTLLLSVYIAPHSKFLSEELLNQEKISDQILSIKSNDLVNFKGINGFIYSRANKEDFLEEVSLFVSNESNTTFVTAEKLFLDEETSTSNKFLLENGTLYSGIFTNKTRLTSKFEKFNFVIDSKLEKTNNLSFSKIFDFNDSSIKASTQWNISIPITIIVLMILSIYLGRVNPRQGRLSIIIPGMLIYVSYLSLLILSREQISNGTNFEMWYVHLAFICFGLIYANKEYFKISRSGIIFDKNNLHFKYALGFILLLLIFWLV